MLESFLTAHPGLWGWARWLLEFGFRGEFAVIARALTRLQGQLRILDVGCGTGQIAGAFEGHRYLGVDIDAKFIGAAKRGPGMQYAVMDARRLAVGSESVDMVLVSGVLHHLKREDARSVLAEVCRVLRSGGISVIMEDRPVRFLEDPLAWAIHRWDLGGQYRPADDYLAIMPKGLQPIEISTMRSGLCPYLVLILEKVGGQS